MSIVDLPNLVMTDIENIRDEIITLIDTINLKNIDKKEIDGTISLIEELLVKFVKYQDDISYSNSCTELFTYCIQESRFDILELISKYIDIDSQNDDGITLLMDIINYIGSAPLINDNLEPQNKSILQVLKCVKNINLIDFDGNTALSYYFDAIKDYELNPSVLEVINKMLELGADIFLYNQEGISPLDRACIYNKYDIVKLMVTNSYLNGDRVNIDAITVCVYNNVNYDIFELLLEYIEDINYIQDGGRSIKNAIKVSEFNNSDVIELLVAHGLQL